MEVRFEDASKFHRAAAWAVAGGACAAAVFPESIVGALLTAALALAGGLLARSRRKSMALVLLAAPLLLTMAQRGAEGWAAALAGALIALHLASVRARAAQELGAEAPSAARVATVTALCAGAGGLAQLLLPGLAGRLGMLIPDRAAWALAGASAALWTTVAAATLHLVFGSDAVEARLAALRPRLDAELRPLCDAVVRARREAVAALVPQGRRELEPSLTGLSLAALEMAERAAQLGRAVPAQTEGILEQRKATLERAAGLAADGPARQSYLRAAETVEAQLGHVRRTRSVRDRAVAKVHEALAQLERAQGAATLCALEDPGGEVELQLLQERLQERALPIEHAAESA